MNTQEYKEVCEQIEEHRELLKLVVGDKDFDNELWVEELHQVTKIIVDLTRMKSDYAIENRLYKRVQKVDVTKFSHTYSRVVMPTID